MFLVARRKGIIAIRNVIRITPLAIVPLYANFATTPIVNDILGGALGLTLRSIDAARTLGIRSFNRPFLPMPNNVSIILSHCCSPLR